MLTEPLLPEPGLPQPIVPPPVPEPSPAPVEPSPAPVEPSPAPVEPSPAPVPPVPDVASPLVRHLAHQRGVDLTRLPGTGPRGAVTRADVERATARVRSSPYARRRAAELGVALAGLRGSGPGGAVLAADVEKPTLSAALDGARDVPAPRRTGAQQEALKQAVAALMARSKREVPHYYLSTSVDLLPATQWLHEQNLTRPVTSRLLPVALLLKATAAACRAVPDVNGTWEDDRFVPADGVHLGVAVALRGGGLVAPALHDVDRMPVGEVMRALQDLVTRARAGRLRRRELTDATLTVTNLGDLGVDEVLGVIFPPQVALVGFGRVRERPWAVDGLLGVRPVVTATLSADHRATTGHVGARFLTEVDRWLQRPERYEEDSHGR